MSGKKNWKRYAPNIIGGLLVMLVAVSLIMFVRNMLDKPVSTKKMVQQITLIQPPPPPPKLEKPPEPEIKEEVNVPEPENTPEEMPDPMADDAPLGEDLALDAEGVEAVILSPGMPHPFRVTFWIFCLKTPTSASCNIQSG